MCRSGTDKMRSHGSGESGVSGLSGYRRGYGSLGPGQRYNFVKYRNQTFLHRGGHAGRAPQWPVRRPRCRPQRLLQSPTTLHSHLRYRPTASSATTTRPSLSPCPALHAALRFIQPQSPSCATSRWERSRTLSPRLACPADGPIRRTSRSTPPLPRCAAPHARSTAWVRACHHRHRPCRLRHRHLLHLPRHRSCRRHRHRRRLYRRTLQT